MKKLALIFFGLMILWFNGLIISPPPVHAAWTQNDTGIQTFYQDKVPQLTSTGKIQSSYTRDSFFPLGLYWVDIGPVPDSSGHPQAQLWKKLNLNPTLSRNTLPELRSAAFNTIIRLITHGPAVGDKGDIIPNEAELDLVDRSGLKAFISLYEQSLYAIHNTQGQNLTKLKATVSRLKKHSSVIGYSLFDELKNRYSNTLPMDDAKWTTVHDTIKSVDPNSTVYANNTKGGHCFSSSYSDMNGFDYYGKLIGESGSMDLVGLGKATSRNRNCDPTLPVFVVIQAYARPTIGTSTGKLLPTPAELRSEYYTVIAHGATAIGLFMQNTWYTEPWDKARADGSTGVSPQVNASLWAAADKANHEIETWKWVFLAKTATDQYHVAFDNHPGGLTSLLKNPSDGNRYLLVVSENVPGDPTGSHAVQFTFSSSPAITKVTSLFDNTNLPVSNNTFSSVFKKGDVSFFKIESTPSGNPKPGDFNSDGKVDLVDASIIIAKFGNPYTVVDYTIMLTNFGK